MVQVDGADVSGAWSDAEGGTGPAAPSRVDGRASRWNDHRATRRNELVRAAVKSVRRRGADVSMDELASDIGTSKSILYRYFTDKAGLQRAVGQVVLDRMLGELTDASRRVGGPRERIRSMVDVYLGMVDDAPHLYAFVTAPGEAAAGEVRGFVDEIDVLVARTLVPTVLGLDSDASPDDLSGDEAVRATLWAAGVVGTVRAVAERWLDARSATAEAPDAVTAPTGGLRSDIESLVAGISREEVVRLLASWLWDGAVGVARRARSDSSSAAPAGTPTRTSDPRPGRADD
jgi:AcrR family transcriptional regulator